MPPPLEVIYTEAEFLALDHTTLTPNTAIRISCPPRNPRGYAGFLKRGEVRLLVLALPGGHWKLCSACSRVSPASDTKLCPLCAHRVLVKHHKNSNARARTHTPNMEFPSERAARTIALSNDTDVATLMTQTHLAQVRRHNYRPGLWDYFKKWAFNIPTPEQPGAFPAPTTLATASSAPTRCFLVLFLCGAPC